MSTLNRLNSNSAPRTPFSARQVSTLVVTLLTAAWLVMSPLSAQAADNEFALVIKDHRFIPEEVKVPSGKKVKLLIDNQDPTPEEFESHDLNREKVIPGSSKATILIGPLKPGKYTFFGEFNEKTARGVVIAE